MLKLLPLTLTIISTIILLVSHPLLLIYNPRYLNHGLSFNNSAKNQREKTLNILATLLKILDKEKKKKEI